MVMQIQVTRFFVVGINFLYSLGSIPGGVQRLFSAKGATDLLFSGCRRLFPGDVAAVV